MPPTDLPVDLSELAAWLPEQSWWQQCPGLGPDWLSWPLAQRDDAGIRWVATEEEARRWYVPDLTDAPTVGALLGWLESVTGWTCWVEPSTVQEDPADGWQVTAWTDEGLREPWLGGNLTRVHALVAALAARLGCE